MASTVDEITINYEEDGIQLVKELDREVLSKGGWTTIMFKYVQWEKAKEAYGEEKYTIRRYRKIKNDYIQQAKFNISSPEQARKIIEVLQKWIG